MAPKLSREMLVTLAVLVQRGQPNGQIAQTLGVTEGTVRYHRRRAGCADGRRDKPAKARALAGVIDAFVRATAGGPADADRPINVPLLYDQLCAEHGYAGSYKSVLR